MMRNRRSNFKMDNTLKKQNVPVPHRAPQLRVAMPGKKTPQHLAVKISGAYLHLGEMEGCWKPRSPLKRSTYRFTH